MSNALTHLGFLLFLIIHLSATKGENANNRTVRVNRANVRVSPLGTVSSDPKDIHFNVYSDSSHPDNFREIIIGDIMSLENSGLVPGPIVMLVGPFGGDDLFLKLRNDYLSQGVKNIIFADTGKLSQPVIPFPIGYISYFAAMKNVPKVGKKGAAFIDFIVRNKKVKDAGDIHLVGWSLGTHKAASIGRYLQERYKMTVGRITGIDVAGPFMQLLGKNQFNKKYGKFVDAIHSNIDGFGTPKSLGHADFFINGGKAKNQVDCRNSDLFNKIPCAHTVAFELFRKSVTEEKEFIGCTCTATVLPPEVCGEKKGKCENPTLVGEHCPTRARGNYYVKVTENLGAMADISG